MDDDVTFEGLLAELEVLFEVFMVAYLVGGVGLIWLFEWWSGYGKAPGFVA